MALRKFLYQDATDLIHAEQASTDELSLGKITFIGVSGVAVDLGGSRATNAGTPTASTDLATKAYVDLAVQGLDAKASVTALATSNVATLSGLAETVDGVALDTIGYKVLLTNQTTGSENGIWVIASGAWTRAVDMATGSSAASAYVFVERGTAYADSGWVCTNDVGSDVVGTDTLAFVQFSGAGQITAGAGLTKSGNTLNVGDGAGILVNADSIEVELATDPALEFDAVGVGGKLRFKPDTTRGLNRDASGAFVKLEANFGLEFEAGGGVGIKINDTPDTLDVGAAGLSVSGVPANFKVAGSATGATVTAANLNTLTNGSNADALHSHAGDAVTYTADTGGTTKGDGVYISANDSVAKGDCTAVAKSYIIGIADATVLAAASVVVKASGICTGVLSGATAGVRYFLSSTGAPVLAGSLPGGARTIQLGIAKNATDLAIQIFDYGKKA